jgi:hypothetical protein
MAETVCAIPAKCKPPMADRGFQSGTIESTDHDSGTRAVQRQCCTKHWNCFSEVESRNPTLREIDLQSTVVPRVDVEG